MAYTKTTWTEATGITTARLNNLETQHDKAIAEAASMVNNAKPVIGSYTGTGSSVTLNLGFRPKLIIVSAVDPDVSQYLLLFAFDGSAEYGNIALGWEIGLRMSEYVTFLTTGAKIDSNFSDAGIKYGYIAFR